MDKRGCEIDEGNDFTAYDAGYSDRREPTETFCNIEFTGVHATVVDEDEEFLRRGSWKFICVYIRNGVILNFGSLGNIFSRLSYFS